MLRVLHCIYDDPDNPWVAGGGAVRVRELYRRLKGEVVATVVTGAFPGARDETIDGIHYERLGAPRPYAWSRVTYTCAATRLLTRAEYDVGVFDFSTYAPIRVPRDRPVGITVHHISGDDARKRWGVVLGSTIGRMERRLLRRARCVSATSKTTRAQIEPFLGSEIEIVDVEAGVPDELFSLEREERNYVLFFGRLDWHQKGLDVLLAAARSFLQRTETELWIAGRGRDFGRVRDYLAQHHLDARVKLLGPVSNGERLELFAHAKLLLMPSRFEGFGMVAAEAMAAGLPVVAAAAGSLPEVITPSGGVLFRAEDADALAYETTRLLGSAELRREMSREARIAAARFRWDAVAKQHLEFLRCIMRRSTADSRHRRNPVQ